MKLKNNFTSKTRTLFMDVYGCSKCGSNQMVELDHIFGRLSNSPLNASPVCRECHQDKVESRMKGKLMQLGWTLKHLVKGGYDLQRKDYIFLKDIRTL